MSFGATNDTKRAQNNLGGVANTAQNTLFPAAFGTGQGELGSGQSAVQSGTDWLQSILGGNQANTTAALQPSIDQIRSGTSGTLNAINTLMPRGGGRYGALFGQSLAPQSQIQGLFNQARTTAAAALPQIGLQRMGVGTNLFNIGNQSLGTASNASSNLADISQRQQQMSNALWSGLGGGLFSLATTPLSGGGQTLAGKLLGIKS